MNMVRLVKMVCLMNMVWLMNVLYQLSAIYVRDVIYVYMREDYMRGTRQECAAGRRAGGGAVLWPGRRTRLHHESRCHGVTVWYLDHLYC